MMDTTRLLCFKLLSMLLCYDAYYIHADAEDTHGESIKTGLNSQDIFEWVTARLLQPCNINFEWTAQCTLLNPHHHRQNLL